MSAHDSKKHAHFWEADDFKLSPRPLRALNLHLTTYCNLQCTECSSGNPRIRYPEHYDVDYFKHAARYLKGLEHITITGGEATLNPQFAEIVPNLKDWFGCENIALETNGAKIIEHEPVLNHFDDILISHYPDNADAVSFLAAKNKDSRPQGPTIHVTKARRAKNPAPCRRANFLQYVYGRLYPCTYVPDGCENIGIPLTKNWKEEIRQVELPCANCCFANEAEGAPNDTKAYLLAPRPAPTSADLGDRAPDALHAARPAWRFPPRPDELKIFGLDLDSWMGEAAEVVIDPAKSMDQLLILFESHLPQARHPIALTFSDQRENIIHRHEIKNPGVTGVKIKLRDFMVKPDDSFLTVRCDRTFDQPADGGVHPPRRLGVRVRSLRYVATPRRGEKAPLYDEQLRLLNSLSQQVSEKEAMIQSMQAKLDGRLFGLLHLKRHFKSTPDNTPSSPRKQWSPQYWPKSALSLGRREVMKVVRWVRRKTLPRAGDLYQHAPRPMHIPANDSKTLETSAPMPSISIVTPSFNQAAFLGKTIQSVIGQNYPALTYSVQDGGSDDGSQDILASHAASLSHSESRKDNGQAHAINLGFARSQADIMGWLNSDDMLLPGALHYVGHYFATHPQVDAIYGHRILMDENDHEVGRWVLPPHDSKVLGWADYVPQETLFWRRSIWEKSGGKLDESFQFAMDWDLLLRFQDAGANIVRVPRFLGAFRLHPLQKTSALVEKLGFEEMSLLRERTHGRAVSREEIRLNTAPFLLKCMVHQARYRSGLGSG